MTTRKTAIAEIWMHKRHVSVLVAVLGAVRVSQQQRPDHPSPSGPWCRSVRSATRATPIKAPLMALVLYGHWPYIWE